MAVPRSMCFLIDLESISERDGRISESLAHSRVILLDLLHVGLNFKERILKLRTINLWNLYSPGPKQKMPRLFLDR